MLLRITDFDSGELLVNGRDLRRHSPAEYHERATAVFQGFARFEGTLQQNVGVGYVADMRAPASIDRAVTLAGARGIVGALPHGLKTPLDAAGCSPFGDAAGGVGTSAERRHVGLSGGEVRPCSCLRLAAPVNQRAPPQWQRVALSRAFMRATRPEVELIVLDEPVRVRPVATINPQCSRLPSSHARPLLAPGASLRLDRPRHSTGTRRAGYSRRSSKCRAHQRASAPKRSSSSRTGSPPRGGRTRSRCWKTAYVLGCDVRTQSGAHTTRSLSTQTITEFGTHQELLQRDGSYAALYRASV